MNKVRFQRFAFALALTFASLMANAGLLGTTVFQCANTVYSGTVTTDKTFCNTTEQPSPSSAVIGNGVEFDIAGNRFFDFGDASLSIRYVQPVGSSSPDLVIFTLQHTISSVSLNGANPINVTWAFSGNLLGILVNSPLLEGMTSLRTYP